MGITSSQRPRWGGLCLYSRVSLLVYLYNTDPIPFGFLCLVSDGVQLHCTNSAALYEETVNAKYIGVLSLFENHGSIVQLIFHREMTRLVSSIFGRFTYVQE